MKQILRFLFIAFFLLLQAQLLANTVIVKGTVKDSSNNPIANKTVRIFTNDSTQGCVLSHTVTTNPNGYYVDTLSCNTNISKLIIIVENCNGQRIIHDPVVGLNGIVESNFVICRTNTTPAPVTCKAAFSFYSTATGMKFKSYNTSTLAAGDSIISRKWTFGDGTSLIGNQADTIHAYAKPGVYNVCLTIKTKKGCESSSCQTVVFTPSSNDCKIESVIKYEKLAPRKFRFSSSNTTILQGDSIFQRIWKFSDGTSLDGNQVNPLKEFKDTGVYTICVSIKTMKGCDKQFCLTITVRDSVTTPPPTGCKAEFSTNIQGLNVKFNSANANPGPGDSIISRTWIFGDSSAALTGNRFDPSHLYTKAGNYTACLIIKTKKGCESKYCFELKLRDSTTAPTGCKATFTYSIKDSVITFNSSASTGTSPDDSIISRTWYYIDGSTNVSLGGNVISPSYSIANIKPGIYSVKLVIKTRKGCESKFEGKVTIPPPPPPTGCKATFTYSIKDSVITFNSSASTGTSPDDSIISRTWYYIDNANMVTLGGNVVSPSYPLTGIQPGNYTVKLVIKTKKGCENKFEGKITIPPPPAPTGCKAVFSYANMQNGTVKFNSSASKGSSPQDSIVSRTWIFGDSSIPVQGNIDPYHNYTKAGKYTVTLYIKTKSGCESKYSESINITLAPPVNCNVEVQFTADRISLKKVQFNSSLSKAQPGDSIIQRNWKFGDNTSLSGNEIKPVKEYPFIGIYTACLEVKTARGCVAQVCKQVIVQDSVTTPQASVDYLKIMSINPNPVITRMVTTIFSRNSNVEVEIAVYDIYGVKKLTMKKLLSQGNNNIEVNVGNLYHGPYFLRVTSRSGGDSKAFYKL